MTKNWCLYLDDIRDCPDDGVDWTVARSTEEAKKLVLEMGLPMLMSLDHDLGGEDTTMRFLSWLVYDFWACLEGKNMLPAYRIHSANPVGALNIDAFMKSWAKVNT
ncbi:MAG: cyclic-phosphate processing receiver domain-containing protein [Candidatus Paceibacterota bacterium]|jgi:hypothetical protein